MAFTPEQLSEQPLCGAKKRNGATCRMFAGAGTAHKGVGRCKWHLGNTATHQTSAVKQEAALRLGSSIDVTPGQAMQGLLNVTAGTLAWLTAMVGGLSDEQLSAPNMYVSLWNDERDRMARIAKAAAGAGLKERQIQLAEQQTAMMGELLSLVMDRLNLTQEQRKALGPALREASALMLGSGEDDVVDAEVVDEPSDPVAA